MTIESAFPWGVIDMIWLGLGTLAAGGITTMLLLIAGHCFRWERILGQPLPRLAAYVYGVLAIIAGSGVWAILNSLLGVVSVSPAYVVIVSICMAVCGGIATTGAWIVDALIDGHAYKRGWLHAVEEVDTINHGLEK